MMKLCSSNCIVCEWDHHMRWVTHLVKKTIIEHRDLLEKHGILTAEMPQEDE